MRAKEGNDYRIVPAEPTVFAKYYATYRPNVWFRPSWQALYEMLSQTADGYWIMEGDERVAGAFLPDQSIGLLIELPAYPLTAKMISCVAAYVGSLASPEGGIYAYNVPQSQQLLFIEAGFTTMETRVCMMRPTEAITAIQRPDYPQREAFYYKSPEKVDVPQVAALLEQAFDANSPDYKDLQAHIQESADYFMYANSNVLQASSIAYDKHTHEVAGICLVSLWEGLPLIYNLAVHPSYRKQGLASYLLDRAIDTLDASYPVVRLFATVGNDALRLYTSKGFLSGGANATMRLGAERQGGRS